MYLRWQRSLPREIRVVPVELPGRGVRTSEAFMSDFDSLIEHLCEVHDRHCLGRYALYGHSMGALIAYAMAMRWRTLSRPLPESLFASGSPAPSRRDPGYFADKHSDAALIAELRKQDGTPEPVFEDPAMLHLTLGILRADYGLCAGYRYHRVRPLDVPIHVLAGRQDDIEADRIMAWEAETSRQFSVRWFEGGHFFIRQQEPAVLGAITQQLRNPHPAESDTCGNALPVRLESRKGFNGGDRSH